MRFREFKVKPLAEAILDEVSMSPTTLKRWAESDDAAGVLMGFEFEMIVPSMEDFDDDFRETEPDYSSDDRVYSIDDIVEFFEGGDYGNSVSREVKDEMYQEFDDWISNNFDNYMDNNYSYFIETVEDILKDNYDLDEAYSRAREELGDDADDDALADRAIEIRNEDIAYIIEVQDSSEWYAAAESVKEDMEQDYQNEVSQSEWLEAIGIENASDAENRWDGLYWPYHNDGGGVSFDDVAADFANAIGISINDINVGSSYHDARREEGKWCLEPDSSIDADSGEAGLEFISPAQPIDTTMDQLQKLMKWAKQTGCRTNSSTGLHTNISFPGYSLENLDYIKLALFMGDNYILDQFDRSTNTYCKSATKIIQNKTRSNPDDVDQVFDKMREHMNVAASKIIHDGCTQKYTSINTKGGYIEFRGPGGDYLNKSIEQITGTALRLAMAMKIACNEEAYREEYGKKLYKLISSGTDETINVFAQYTSGYISKDRMMVILRNKMQAKHGAKSAAAQLGAQQQAPTQQQPAEPYQTTPAPHTNTQPIYYNVGVGGGNYHIQARSEEEAINRLRSIMAGNGDYRTPSEFTATPAD